MKIVCIGANKVNFFVAEQLVSEGNELVFIDKNESKLTRIQEKLDVVGINKDATIISDLIDAEIEDADVLVATGKNDKDNIIISAFAKEIGVNLCIARIDNFECVRNKESIKTIKNLGVDFFVNRDDVITGEINNALKFKNAFESKEYNHGVLLVSIKINSSMNIFSKKIKRIESSGKYKIATVINKNANVFMPDDDYVIEDGDLIYVALNKKDYKNMYLDFFSKEMKTIENVIIIGTESAEMISKKLSKNFKIKFIEENRDKAQNIAEKINRTVIHSDELNLLNSDIIKKSDAVVVQHEKDIVRNSIAIIAKKAGANYVITALEKSNADFVYTDMGIDSVFNSNLGIANEILKKIYNQEEIKNFYILHTAKLRSFSIKIINESKFLGKNILKLKKQNISVFSIYRNEKSFLPKNDDEIILGDLINIIDVSEMGENIWKFLSSKKYNT